MFRAKCGGGNIPSRKSSCLFVFEFLGVVVSQVSSIEINAPCSPSHLPLHLIFYMVHMICYIEDNVEIKCGGGDLFR